MKIILAGGTGFVGRALTKSFIDNGDSVIILTRNPEAAIINGNPGAKYEKWDASTVSSWADRMAGSDVVINLAGEPLASKRWTILQKDRILNSRINATRAIVDAIAESDRKPSVLISCSAARYYGDVKAGVVDESHAAGNDFLANVCVNWEAEAIKAQEYGVRTVLLRTGVILEKDGGALKLMLSAFRMYAGGTPGSGEQWVPWIRRDDVVRAIRFILEKDNLNGPVNVTSPNPVTMKELATTLGELLLKPMWAPVPTVMLKAVLGEMADMLLTGQKAIPEKLMNAGFKFRHPQLRKALAAILKNSETNHVRS